MRILSLAALLWTLLVTAPLAATPTTSTGQISIAQVMEMLDGAETDEWKRMVVTAYLAGLGETAGLMIANGARYGATLTCRRSIALDTRSGRRALEDAAVQAEWPETAATPILINDLMERAGCR